ncbi:hypothetical protein MIT9_P0981 [Methylomarinovum caldicuralii]|uniref:HTH cro/C1-type domain-containing protein n=1 Tax=Methylomarinovum caldicuralii TaxID=438856 RepID=A0AAU9C1E8_9GAMM|nr:addiction module antidote protein [Methylomarinovum caldicuralii]BCX81403.1 hypothetical protein MIT9_P0981 [Methylomarinovum caldicuralii]
MNDPIKIHELPVFDPAEHLKDRKDIAAYLAAVLEEGDPAELAQALGVVAKARGMTEIAREAGISRETLYRALQPGNSPKMDIIIKVCRALGCKLTVIAA